MWQALAPELVFEIFRHFLPGLTLSVTEPKLFPWYLGQICGSWRSVFISHARFWSNLIVEADFYDVRCAKHALQILELCLARSNDQPLSFKLTYVLFKASDDRSRRARKTLSKRCLPMLNLLMGESTRWRDVYITMGEPELPILYKIHHKLPMLRSVQILLSDVDGVVTRPPPIYEDLFENAPQWRRLYIHRDPSWKADWSALTVIYLRCPSSVAEHLDILSRVSRLEELAIRGEFMMTILPNAIPPITLPFLKILRTDSEDVLFLFRTPVLQELWIGFGSGFGRSDAILCLPTLLHLTKLTLIATMTSDVEIILQHMPALPDLTLYLYETDCLKLLSECPKLRCLKTLTVCVLSGDEDRWANITTWMKRKSLPRSVRYFEGLECLSLKLSEMPGHSHIPVVKKHLEAEGIRNSIQLIRDLDSRLPFFDDLFQC
jgi:hypothetical protein